MHVVAAPSRRTPLTLLALLAVTSLGVTTGCAFLKRLSGSNTVDLEGADVKSVGADIRKQQKTICPREQVQMGVFMEVTLKGEKQAKSFETWEGHGEGSKNDRIEFSEFAFHSEMGSFDEAGWFRPNPDMKASADKEFVLQTVYKRRPDKFSLETKYKPDYSCVKRAGKPGPPGPSGSSGSPGKDGSLGQSGGQTSAGSDGGDGSDGGSGSGGGDGGDGAKIQAFATMVKTPFYDKLVAIRLTGDLDDLLLAPPDQPLTLSASGGPGGRGGNGGNGGRGGGGGSGSQGGKGGKGGKGGDGASGGKGGKGGEIELIFDERFPDLGSLIKLEVAGGDGGSPGGSGSPGSGGSAGPGSGQNGKLGSSGPDGSRGRDGGAGPAGPAGRAAARAGSVGDRFAGLGAITPLGDAQPAAPPKDDPKAKGKKDEPKGKKDEPKGKKK